MAMAMTASLKEMVRPVSIPPPFGRSCGALMQVSFGRPSSHTTKKLGRVRRDALFIHLPRRVLSRQPSFRHSAFSENQPFLCVPAVVATMLATDLLALP